MNRILILAVLALSACQLSLPVKLPTPAEICAMTPATRAAVADALQTDLDSLTAACEIVK